MKVVDMFGSKLPVCAFEFESIGELVNIGVNGLVFKDSQQLAHQLFDLFLGFPQNSRNSGTASLNSLKENLSLHPLPNWETNWKMTALPALIEMQTAGHGGQTKKKLN